MSGVPNWDERTSDLLGRSEVPAAIATGSLLAAAKPRWDGRVVPRTSLHDLLFTVPGYEYPFEESVRVSCADDVFTFSLVVSGIVQSADHCSWAKAELVLDSFLVQLVGGELSATNTVESDYDRVVSAIRAAWEDGCPVASDPDGMATLALGRSSSIRRRLRATPDRQARIEDLANGLRDRFEKDAKSAGPLMEDYRHLAARIVDALA